MSPKLAAALQTACICASIEAFIVLVLGTLMDSYLGAAVVSMLVLGPLSFWIAAPIYRYLLRTRT